MGSIAGIAARNIPVPAVQQNAELIATGVAFATDPLAGVVRLALSGGLGWGMSPIQSRPVDLQWFSTARTILRNPRGPDMHLYPENGYRVVEGQLIALWTSQRQ